MKLTIKVNLSPEREKWATSAWQSVLAANETDAATLEEYLSDTLKQSLQDFVDVVTDSWRPVDTVEVKTRREKAIAALKDIPVEKLELIEASIEASKLEV